VTIDRPLSGFRVTISDVHITEDGRRFAIRVKRTKRQTAKVEYKEWTGSSILFQLSLEDPISYRPRQARIETVTSRTSYAGMTVNERPGLCAFAFSLYLVPPVIIVVAVRRLDTETDPKHELARVRAAHVDL